MTADTYIKLAQATAWPLVALFGVLILGPGGLLKQLFAMLTESVLGLNKAVADFKETTATMKMEMDRFAETSDAMASSFARRVDTIKTSVENTRNQLDDLLDKAERLGASTSAILGELVAREIGSGSSASIAHDEPAQEIPNSEVPVSPNGRYDAIRDEWDEFVTSLKIFLNRDDIFDARQIGRMAGLLVDARRKKRLSDADADAIANLHSKFKSFARLYHTRDEWLTEDVFKDFIQQLRAAEKPLRD